MVARLAHNQEVEGSNPSPATTVRFLECSTCRQLLPETSFSLKRNSKRGRHSKCKGCHNAYVRESWYKRNAEKQKASSKRWKDSNPHQVRATRYGSTPEKIAEILAPGVCAICQKSKSLVIDHDHRTGEVRDALCYNCNIAIGQFDDSVILLERAIAYLKRHGSATNFS